MGFKSMSASSELMSMWLASDDIAAFGSFFWLLEASFKKGKWDLVEFELDQSLNEPSDRPILCSQLLISCGKRDELVYACGGRLPQILKYKKYFLNSLEVSNSIRSKAKYRSRHSLWTRDGLLMTWLVFGSLFDSGRLLSKNTKVVGSIWVLIESKPEGTQW
jgi:hypothetical protein